jgi:hypothetical protein
VKGGPLVLCGLILGMSISALMQTFISATGPEIAASLGAASSYPWIFSAYLFASTVSIPIFGKAGESVSIMRLYALGAVLFGAGSLLCSFAPTMAVLIIGRAISGFGSGAVVPAAYALAGKFFSEKDLRKVFAIMGASQIVANIAGPVLGAIFSIAFWRYGFGFTALLAVVAAALVIAGGSKTEKAPVPRFPKKEKKAIDWVGALLLCCSLLGLSLSFQFFRESRIAVGIGILFAAIMLGIAALFWEKRHVDPIFPIDTFREPGMVSMIISALTIGAVSSAALAFAPLAMRSGGEGWGRSVVLIPMMAAAGMGTLASGLVSKKNARALGATAWMGSALSFLLLAALKIFPSAALAGLAAVPAGFGMGYLWPALLGRSQRGIAAEKLSSLGGMLQLARNLGGSASVSILGVLYAGPEGRVEGVSWIFLSLAVLAITGPFSWLRAKRAEF